MMTQAEWKVCAASWFLRGLGRRRLSWITSLYVVAFCAAVAWTLARHDRAPRVGELLFLASGFPLVAVVMRTLGAALVKNSELERTRVAEESLRQSEASFRLLFADNPQP